MYLTVVTLSCSLFAQAASETPLVPIQSTERRTAPADLVAEALTLPEGAALTGSPLTLVRALSSARGSRQQLEVTHAYWRLTMAVAEYRFSLKEHEQLGRIEARPADAMMLAAARASAAAAVRMAELEALCAQHDLAEAAMLPATAPLPLPADPPHVGTYRTYFEEVFSARNPPARARLIHRNLPIRRQAIEVRALAVRAAQDALEAATEAHQVGRADLGAELSAIRQLGRQCRALLTSVCNYNHDIADYALSVAGPQTDENVLAAMLIRPSQDGTRPAARSADSAEASQPSDAEDPSAPPSEVRPATLNEPVPSPSTEQSAPAPPQGELQSLGQQTPTLAPPQESAEPDDAGEPATAKPSGDSEQSVMEKPAQAPPSDGAAATIRSVPAETSEPERPMVPVPAGASTPIERTANKPVVDEQGISQPTSALYPGLVAAKPAVRAKHLNEALHWRRTLPEPLGEPIDLRECLAGVSGADRRPVIAAYWLAAQRAAEYQVLAGQVDFLEELVPVAMERRNEPLGPAAMLDLRALRLAAQADLLRAHLELLDAQFQLTRRVGRPLDSPWLLPATTPHAGPYLLKLEAQPRELVESWPLRRLAAVIPALADGLQGRAAAVVEADAARAAATEGYRAGTEPMPRLLASITRQTEETLAFLETLTEYNEAIADYALAVLPSTIPAEQLAKTLVVTR